VTVAQHLLIINPGSTSTKTALFDGVRKVADEAVRHEAKELARFDNVADQFEYRMGGIDRWIESLQLAPGQIKAVVGRGAPLRPLEGGSYEITELMLSDLRAARYSNHASNLGAIIAHHLAARFGVPCFITDPITVDNFTDVARISGLPEITRKCRVHALNIKEVARREAARLGEDLSQVDFVVAHMGGGVSVAALKAGLVVDVNDALLGMGPFSPDRAGALPIGALVELCYSGKYTKKELLDKLSKQSGLMAYLGEADLRKVEVMIEQGDDKARLCFDAMAYQIAKEIGAIILTGGMAHSQRLIEKITEQVGWMKRVAVVPGEFEMEALAAAGVRYLDGEERLKPY
jgi:butyrate kinase